MPALATSLRVIRPPWRPAAVVARMARRPVLGIFAIALAIRTLVAVVITIGWGGSLFLDDASYARLAEMVVTDDALEDPYLEFVYERTATLLVPITGLYALFGPLELLGQLYVALLGAATAALTTRLAMEIVDRRFAMLAGLIVALLPSQVLWSSLILKDAAVWAVLSGLALVVAVAARTEGRRLALLGVVAALLLALLGFLRLHTLEIACVAIFLAVLASPRRRLLTRTAGAAVLLAVVPFAFGMGVAGGPFVVNSRDPGEQRVLNANDADTAVVETPAPTPTTPDKPRPPAATAATADPAPPASTPALTPLEETSTVSRSLSYLPAGVAVVALRPWPWEASDASLGVRMARAETIIWYPLLLLALVGLTTVWRHRGTLAFPVLAGAAILVAYGLAEGNLGTAYRHRGEFVWVVALLAALGVERIVRWRAPDLAAA